MEGAVDESPASAIGGQLGQEREQPPIFTVVYDVENDQGRYNDFIRNLRQQLATGQQSHNIPVLPRQHFPPNQWFHVQLQSRQGTTTLRIRRDNIYIFGFQAGLNGLWWEFSPQDENFSLHLIPGSTFLPFTDQYQQMGGVDAPSTAVVGRDQLLYAVNMLLHHDGSPQRSVQTGRALCQLSVMISEALRLHPIYNFVFSQIHNRRSAQIGTNNSRLMRSWGAISFELLSADRNNANFQLFPHLSIDSPDSAASTVGLILNGCELSSYHPTSHTSLVNAPDTLSRQLVEIYSLQILNIDNENPGDLYGTIRVIDDILTPQYIYNHDKSNTESIKPNEFATLTGPARAISALDGFNIEVSLMDHDSLSPDDDVATGTIYWSYYDASNVYNKLISESITGKYGEVVLNYAVYSNAVAAKVEVTLINGDGENPADVYGKLHAYNTMVTTPIVLFEKNDGNCVDVKPQELIPLSRSVLVVDVNSSLIIEADLWDYDTISSDDAIAQGQAIFRAKYSGSPTMSIKGKYGEIAVTITWLSNWT